MHLRDEHALSGVLAQLRWRLGGLFTEIAKFGTVGLMAFVIDVGLFNLLRFAGADHEGVLFDRPLTAKMISVIVAIVFSYYVNRQWTYAGRSSGDTGRELVLFFAINGAAMLIAMGTLWMSHYALGLTSPIADNLSANGVGLALGTMFRFWAYRTYVFPEAAGLELESDVVLADAGSVDS